MSPAPLFWITVLCLLSGLLGLSVSGWRHGKAVQQIVLGSAGLLGVLLSLTFFLAPLGLPMAACAPVTYVACRLVAGLASLPTRLVAALVAFGLITAPFADRIGFEIRTARERAAHARGWAELARTPLAAQIGTLRLQLPFTPQIRLKTSCPRGAAAAPGVCVITALDARPQAHDPLQGGPPPPRRDNRRCLSGSHSMPRTRRGGSGLSRFRRSRAPRLKAGRTGARATPRPPQAHGAPRPFAQRDPAPGAP